MATTNKSALIEAYYLNIEEAQMLEDELTLVLWGKERGNKKLGTIQMGFINI